MKPILPLSKVISDLNIILIPHPKGSNHNIVRNGTHIDIHIYYIIDYLWRIGIKTYSSCQGGVSNIDEFDETNKQFYYKNKRRYECAWIILDKKNVGQVECLLANKFNYKHITKIKGSNGYMIDNVKHDDLVFICWKRI